MVETIRLNVNGAIRELSVDPETPLLYVLRQDLGLKGPKYGCGLEQCGACKVLVDGTAVQSCKLPVAQVSGQPIVTVEGLAEGDELHPLQEAFIHEQAIQCGYCAAGMIIAAQGLLNRVRYPTDDDIRAALADNLCRCGVYDRVRRAIRLRIGRPYWDPIYELRDAPALSDARAREPSPPPSLIRNPELDAWLRVEADETITVFTGKAEIGQGIQTAVAQIAAEELDVDLERIQVSMADTGRSPDEGLTAGSMSLEHSGNAIRWAAADARHLLLNLAFEELEAVTPPDELRVEDGTITDPATGRQTTYWRLMGGRPFGHQVSGAGRPKRPETHQIVGQPETRLDLRHKVSGQPVFIQDLALPDMLYGRVVRPPGYHARLISVNQAAIEQLPGVVSVVVDGSFLAVIAAREDQAITAADALRQLAEWRRETDLPPSDTLFDRLPGQPAQSLLIEAGAPVVGEPPPPISAPEAVQTVSARYHRPYHMHGPLGPSAAVAQFDGGQLTVWSHSQGVYPLRLALAQALALPESAIRVIFVPGAGCYGHNGADDVALDAALMAQAIPGRPVSVQWSREDEHAWEPYGAAMVIGLQADLDGGGRVAAWNHEVWSYPHLGRPYPSEDSSGLLAAWHRARPLPRQKPRLVMRPHIGSHRNADPLYNFARRRVVKHFVSDSPLRTSSLRALGAYGNIFAIESFMDELAQAAGADPVAFRLRHMADERARAVIRAAAEKAGWQSRARPAGDGRGRGLAFAQYKNKQCYAAIVVEVTVDAATGQVRVERAVIAADAGQVVNPDGLSNQLEGGFVQALSWTLKEQVAWDAQGITSRDWDSYPILSFLEAPVVETVLLNRPDHPFLGSGEATQGPTPAAVANAIYDAVGRRLRELPFRPEKVRAALENWAGPS